MIKIFIITIFVMFMLVMFMFLILKKTVKIVNEQTKSYFVNKLQGYDELIDEKEQALNEIEKKIKNKEKEIINEEEKSFILQNDYDYGVINLLAKTKYYDDDFYKIEKLIDEKFNIDYERLIKEFVKFSKKKNDYNFCKKMRNKFSYDVIYNLKISMNKEDIIKELLDKRELKIYDIYTSLNHEFSVEKFVDYLDQMLDINNPSVTVFVGKKGENYNNLGKNIVTKYDSRIYRGIKILYQNKIYDFSLSERNE